MRKIGRRRISVGDRATGTLRPPRSARPSLTVLRCFGIGRPLPTCRLATSRQSPGVWLLSGDGTRTTWATRQRVRLICSRRSSPGPDQTPDVPLQTSDVRVFSRGQARVGKGLDTLIDALLRLAWRDSCKSPGSHGQAFGSFSPRSPGHARLVPEQCAIQIRQEAADARVSGCAARLAGAPARQPWRRSRPHGGLWHTPSTAGGLYPY